MAAAAQHRSERLLNRMNDPADPMRPMQVVFIDNSYLHQIGWVEKFAKSVSGFDVILLTDKAPSRIDGNFEVINVRDVAQQLDLDELQKKYDFSLFRAIIPERAYFDYTNFSSYQCYSRVDLDDIAKLIGPHVNALDHVIRIRADLVIGYLFDNAITSLAAHIAQHYSKAYAAAFPYYWWSDGYIFADRADQTSSQVDALYRNYYANQQSIDRGLVEKLYSTKRASHIYPDAIVYRLSARIRKIFGSRSWHDPFSPRNWIMRRAAYLVSQLLMSCFTRSYPNVRTDKPYVLFPMHVAPEAALLGATPELADQFSIIKNISINLPWGVRLCVKGHPGQPKWTGPGFDFYRRLGALQNVDVIDASAPLTAILQDERCLAVAVINGTVGLEAAMNRKPVFIFGRAIYGVADCFFKPKSFDEFGKQMLAITKGQFEFNEGAMLSILAALDAAVWRGNNDFAAAATAEQAALRSFSTFEAYIRSQT
jgi:hypothetical protein